MLRLLLYGMAFLGLLTLRGQWTTQVFVDGLLTARQAFGDTLEQQRWANNQLAAMWEQGFLFAAIDSSMADKIYFHKGEKINNVEPMIRVYDSDSGIYRMQKVKSPGKFINSFLNSGYPFAKLGVDSVQVGASNYKVYYALDPGPTIRYDSLALLSKVQVNRSFLQSALNLESGDLFSEQDFQNISKNIQKVPFLKLNRPPDIAFEDGGATVYLDLLQVPSSSFEGVIGFLPGQSASNTLVVTGYLDLQLANLFQSGIGLDLMWNRFADQSQELDLGYFHPYFLSSKLFVDLQLNILKQDTTYLNRIWSIGLGTYLTHAIALQLTYGNEAANLIGAEEQDLVNGFADYQVSNYSLSMGHHRFSTAFGFGKDFRFLAKASLGDKKLLENNNLDPSLYDSLRTNTLRVGLQGGIRYQVPFFRRTALYQKVCSGFIFNDQILNNEISRIGGLRSARGFNENFFFAQHHILSRLEVRQYFERRSFFMVFYDQLFYTSKRRWDNPTGFGLGLNIDTSNGLFTFALAAGKAEDISLDFSSVKVHLGYTTKF